MWPNLQFSVKLVQFYEKKSLLEGFISFPVTHFEIKIFLSSDFCPCANCLFSKMVRICGPAAIKESRDYTSSNVWLVKSSQKGYTRCICACILDKIITQMTSLLVSHSLNIINKLDIKLRSEVGSQVLQVLRPSNFVRCLCIIKRLHRWCHQPGRIGLGTI